MTAPTLADCRNALWDAIDNWPALSGIFALKMRFDEDDGDAEDAQPSISDLPAIAVDRASIQTATFATQTQTWTATFSILVWTQGWNYGRANELIDPVIAALYKSAAVGSSTSYIKSATGFHLDKPPTFTQQRVTLQDADGDGTKAVLTTFEVTLKIHRNPFL